MRSLLRPPASDVDTRFKVFTDAGGRDPDTASPTLRRYHRLLWSKALPSGERFELTESTPGVYLHHRSELGEFVFTGDTVTTGLWRRTSRTGLLAQLPFGRYDRFDAVATTVGSRIIFPSSKIDGKMTINGARGCHPRIMDRFDLTLECIRRHYQGGTSPLTDTLARYSDFFALFETFQGYVTFFHLHDIVSQDYSAVRFHLPFTDFGVSPVPKDRTQYLVYLDSAQSFIKRRNRRILKERREGLR